MCFVAHASYHILLDELILIYGQTLSLSSFLVDLRVEGGRVLPYLLEATLHMNYTINFLYHQQLLACLCLCVFFFPAQVILCPFLLGSMRMRNSPYLYFSICFSLIKLLFYKNEFSLCLLVFFPVGYIALAVLSFSF